MTTTKSFSLPLAVYNNGNCLVRLWSDGCKERSWDGEAVPEFPESIDLKITNRCYQGCGWCHEESVPWGCHATMSTIKQIVADLPGGVEIAIGGGDPLTHPKLLDILKYLRDKGLVPNLTIHSNRLTDIRYRDLVYGLGVSYNGKSIPALGQRGVVHLVAGIWPVEVAFDNIQRNNLLILGFKAMGRGAAMAASVVPSLREWRLRIPELLRSNKHVISFDNLALEQLQVQEHVSEDVWNSGFMGKEGQFTMYVDAVRKEFAASSIATRLPINDRPLRELFQLVRNEQMESEDSACQMSIF